MKFLVAFSSPKRSTQMLDFAYQQAKGMSAELILLRVIPDPKKVGVVAELIATEKPIEKAQQQINEAVAYLETRGVKASGLVKIGPVADTILSTARDLMVDLIYLGTTKVPPQGFSIVPQDPIVHFLVDHSPISLCLIRQPEAESD